MNSDEIYIDGKRITLSEETKVALTYQANNIGDIANRQGSLSNTHKVPAIAVNAEILDSAEQPASETNVPYRKLPYRLVRNGTDVRGFENAYCIVENSLDARWYNITAYGGNLDFFTAIDGKTIRDLDLSDLDHTFDRGTISNLRFAGSGIVYPIIEWSDVDSNGSFSLPTGSRTVDVRNFYFCIYFHTLIERIAAAAGFTFVGDIFSDQRYRSMAINAEDKNAGNSAGSLASAEQSASTTISGVGGGGGVLWCKMDHDIYDPLNVFTQDSNGRWSYQAQFAGSFDFSIYIKAYCAGVNTHLFEVRKVAANGAFISTIQTVSAIHINQTVTLSGVSLGVGERIECYCAASDNTNNPGWLVTVYQFTITCTNINASPVTLGANYPVACNLPNIKQTDMIKCFMQQFALFPVTNSVDRSVKFVRFENVRENVPNAPNWSGRNVGDAKLDASSVKLSYRLQGYAQHNLLRYKHDDLVPGDPGDGVLTVGDETLDLSRDQFVLPFAASYDTTKLQGLPIMRISKYEAGGKVTKCEPRLFQIFTQNLTPGISYTDGSGTNTETLLIGFAYFSRAAMPYNLDFQGALIPNYYGTWRDLIYQPKIIDALVWLNEAQMQEFEHEIPVFVDVANDLISITGNFYVNIISNYVPGKPTAVQLIRL